MRVERTKEALADEFDAELDAIDAYDDTAAVANKRAKTAKTATSDGE